MPGSRPTIYDVAAAAGVSKSLVSRVLRGGERVSPAAAEAVRAAIADLGYRPRRAAADLAASRSRIIGVLIDDYSNPWFVDLVRGLTAVLVPHGYRVSVVDSVTAAGEDPLGGLLSLGADGLIIARDVPTGALGAAAEPVVVAGTRKQAPAGVDAVANDDALGARLATEHLLELGHRVIGHLAVSGGAGDARRESFDDVMRAAGAHAVTRTTRGEATAAHGHAGTVAMLREEPELTGLFAANDVVAIGALGAARELGLRVPEDLSVIGYDDTELAGTRLIDLTTVDDDSRGVGEEAARLLLERMAEREAGRAPRSQGERRVLSPALVVRGTTAAPRPGG